MFRVFFKHCAGMYTEQREQGSVKTGAFELGNKIQTKPNGNAREIPP